MAEQINSHTPQRLNQLSELNRVNRWFTPKRLQEFFRILAASQHGRSRAFRDRQISNDDDTAALLHNVCCILQCLAKLLPAEGSARDRNNGSLQHFLNAHAPSAFNQFFSSDHHIFGKACENLRWQSGRSGDRLNSELSSQQPAHFVNHFAKRTLLLGRQFRMPLRLRGLLRREVRERREENTRGASKSEQPVERNNPDGNDQICVGQKTVQVNSIAAGRAGDVADLT